MTRTSLLLLLALGCADEGSNGGDGGSGSDRVRSGIDVTEIAQFGTAGDGARGVAEKTRGDALAADRSAGVARCGLRLSV